jgi:hypothetical protein
MNRIQSVERHNGQLASVLRDARGIIFIDYLEKSQTINSEYYIGEKTALFEEKKVLFYQDMSQINQNDGKIA